MKDQICYVEVTIFLEEYQFIEIKEKNRFYLLVTLFTGKKQL